MIRIGGGDFPSLRCSQSSANGGEAGFSLAEFMIATLITLVVAAGVFGLLSRIQRIASYQAEVHGVLESMVIGMEMVGRVLEQAGNDPLQAGFPAVAITGATEVRVRSDLTGSARGSPDQGDPDGDTGDSGEDVTIRYNAGSRTLELIPAGGIAQPVVSNISRFSMQYFDRRGSPTNAGDDVRKIRITLTSTSPKADPQTGHAFSMELSCAVRLAARQ
jgi:Tfp pilus assembly protein PilW